MKRLLCVLTVLILAAALVPVTVIAAETPVTVQLNGGYLELPTAPIEINGSTFVPVRAITEALGYTVDWINETQEVLLTKGGLTVLMQIGSAEVAINDNGNVQAVTLRAPLFLSTDYTMVPVRLISEQLGFVVDWVQSTKTVIIVDPSEFSQQLESYAPNFFRMVYSSSSLPGNYTLECREQALIDGNMVSSMINYMNAANGYSLVSKISDEKNDPALKPALDVANVSCKSVSGGLYINYPYFTALAASECADAALAKCLTDDAFNIWLSNPDVSKMNGFDRYVKSIPAVLADYSPLFNSINLKADLEALIGAACAEKGAEAYLALPELIREKFESSLKWLEGKVTRASYDGKSALQLQIKSKDAPNGLFSESMGEDVSLTVTAEFKDDLRVGYFVQVGGTEAGGAPINSSSAITIKSIGMTAEITAPPADKTVDYRTIGTK